MAESSAVEDDELTQIASEAEAAYNDSRKQSTVCKQPTGQQLHAELLDQSLSENQSEAVLSDIETDIIRIYSDDQKNPNNAVVCNTNADIIPASPASCNEITCSDENVRMSNCITDSSNQSRASVSDDLVDCNGDISDGHAAQNLASDDSCHKVTDHNVEENLQLSNSGCFPDRNRTTEPAVNCNSSNRLEHAANSEIVNNEWMSNDEECMDELCDGKPMPTDSNAPLACDDSNSGDNGSGSLSAEKLAEESSSKPAEPPSDKKPPYLSFSPDVLLVAPTGKAANVLGRRTGIQAFTLHQVIFSYKAWRECGSSANTGWKFDTVRALVVDESSLVAVTIFYSLISKILRSLQKMVLLGDILQLPSIEPGTPSLLFTFNWLVFCTYYRLM